jgi:hypothetical protein
MHPQTLKRWSKHGANPWLSSIWTSPNHHHIVRPDEGAASFPTVGTRINQAIFESWHDGSPWWSGTSWMTRDLPGVDPSCDKSDCLVSGGHEHLSLIGEPRPSWATLVWIQHVAYPPAKTARPPSRMCSQYRPWEAGLAISLRATSRVEGAHNIDLGKQAWQFPCMQHPGRHLYHLKIILYTTSFDKRNLPLMDESSQFRCKPDCEYLGE